MIRITQTQLLNFTLQKNFLAAQKANDLTACLKACVALPATDCGNNPNWVILSSPFLAARLRLTEFRPSDLISKRDQAGHLGYSMLMRGETHLVLAEDLPYLHTATRRQVRRSFNVEWINWQVTVEEIETLGEHIMAAMSEAPATPAEIAARLAPPMVKPLTYTTRGGRVKTMSNVALALHWLWAMDKISLRQAFSSQDGQDERNTYALRSTSSSSLSLADLPSEAQAQTDLVRAYLAAFGPVTEADIDFWTGFGKSERARAMGQLYREVTQVMVEGMPGTMIMLEEQAEALQATPNDPTPFVHFLPRDDSFVKAYKASRGRFLSNPKMQTRVYRGTGEIRPTILAHGHIVGTWAWQLEADDIPRNTIQRQLFEPLDAALLADIEAAAQMFVTDA